MGYINPISIIACVVGIVGCVIGVATFISAQIVRAKEDGKLMEKVDYLVRGFDEQKKDAKETNRAIDQLLSEHTVAITNLQARVLRIEEEVLNDGK